MGRVIAFPTDLRLSSLRRPPRWPLDWLGFDGLTEGDRAVLWHGMARARPWLHARRLMRRWLRR